MKNLLPPLDTDKIRVSYEKIIHSTTMAVQLEFEGGEVHWLPRSTIAMHEEHKVVDIAEGMYNKTFEK